jgi:hypothetical protein
MRRIYVGRKTASRCGRSASAERVVSVGRPCGARSVESGMNLPNRDRRHQPEACVALVEFVDGRGVEWRAWNITPEDMHPVTAREMFVGETADFQEGWLVFESAGERRRLAPYPHDWNTRSPDGLEALLARATRVAARPPSLIDPRTSSGELRRYEDAGADAPLDVAAAPHPNRRDEDRVR